MAATVTMLLFLLHMSTVSAQEPDTSEQGLPQQRPHLEACFSVNMETFRCRWNAGTFQNLSEAGDLRLFYINKKPISDDPKEWSECPQYGTNGTECFFSENHTSIWTHYNVQLRSRERGVLYSEKFFYIQDIVQPDPPFGLNWTLLNVGLTGTHVDIKLSWEPPQSADVKTGWMALQYEAQYRESHSALWEVSELQRSKESSLYGLRTNMEYEVRVRCKTLASKEFGRFSESVFICVPSKGSRLFVAILIFAALCFIGILMFIMQQKLMAILPPIPGPKIRGIDPELLKKDGLSELMSILVAHVDLRTINSDPWVDFIDLDIEEPNKGSTEAAGGERSPLPRRTPLSIGYEDGDSGRVSSCDMDLPCEPESAGVHPPTPNHSPGGESCAWVPQKPSSSPESQGPVAGVPGKDDLYAQVSLVGASGEVLLREAEDTGNKEKKEATEEDVEKEEVRERDREVYASERDAGSSTPRLSRAEMNVKEFCGFTSSEAVGGYQGPYPDAGRPSCLPMPPQAYTVVEAVDRQNSLILTPNTITGPRCGTPKTVPTPEGYLTPDLLGDITP